MAKPVSPVPANFTDQRERDYWHMAQDIAFRAGASLVMRDGATWLLSEVDEQIVCEPQRPDRVWYETWLALNRRFPLLSRIWVGGRAISKPGEMT
jgi:hypothetical protein